MLFYSFEEMVQFWVVTWALDLKKWLKSRSRWHNTEKLGLWLLAGKPVRVTIGLQSHVCLVMGSNLVLTQLNARLTQGLGTWSGWLAPRGLVAPE